MANHVNTDWGESRLDRQNSVSANGWSGLTDFDDSSARRRDLYRRRRQQRRSRWLSMAGVAALVATAVSIVRFR